MKHWTIDRGVIAATESALRRGQHEVFVIWAGPSGQESRSEDLCVDHCIVPAQTPGITEGGVWVHIEGAELQRIQLANFEASRRSIIQLHSHPGADVRMSSLDRKWEVVRHVGALSIIVPFYGRNGLALGQGANVYEREVDDWRLWTDEETHERLVIA